MNLFSSCAIGISGYSGSGKTTLIEMVLPELIRQGLAVGVLKHTHHTLALDTEGKDTDRFFRAGAAYVAAHDSTQLFGRGLFREGSPGEALATLPAGLDLVIIEGYKGAEIPGPRAWLDAGSQKACGEAGVTGGTAPASSGKISRVICRTDPAYAEQFLEFIHAALMDHHQSRKTLAGLLIGGRSERMGSPKGLLALQGRTLMERTHETLSEAAGRALLLGAGELPSGLIAADRLPDASDSNGPLAGMLSAFRWDPRAAWLISSVDMPLMDAAAWRWVLSQRKPGVWAVMPRRAGSATVEATGACYEPEIFDVAGSLARRGISRLQAFAEHPKVLTPVIPRELEKAWNNVNTPEAWQEVLAALNA